MAVEMAIRDFLNDHSRMEFSFPSSLTREQRAYVHQLVNIFVISHVLIVLQRT